MSWEPQLRRVRQTQSKLDARLTAYSQYASEVAHETQRDNGSAPSHSVALDMTGSGRLQTTPTSSSDATSMETELQGLLAQYADDIEGLAASVQDDPLLPPSHTQMHMIQRHRELLVEFERDFFRCKTQLRHTLDRQQLLGHVKDDINNYREQNASEIQGYLQERTHLDRSHQMIDETLDQAFATQAEFRAQRDILSGSLGRMQQVIAQVPSLNSIIHLISRRRRRDTVILGIVIGVCIVLLLLMGVRR